MVNVLLKLEAIARFGGPGPETLLTKEFELDIDTRMLSELMTSQTLKVDGVCFEFDTHESQEGRMVFSVANYNSLKEKLLGANSGWKIV